VAYDSGTGNLLVAREDAIYTYGRGGRGPSWGFEGPKTSLNLFRDYLALVCPPSPALSRADSFQRFGRSQVDDIFNTATFIIIDPDFRFIAHSESLASGAKHIFKEWGDLFLVTVDGKVCTNLLLVDDLSCL
jgi:hypothetical protein